MKSHSLRTLVALLSILALSAPLAATSEAAPAQISKVSKASKSIKPTKYVATMAKAHLPSAPNNGTDDYRCFLIDPKIKVDSIIKSIEFVPQTKALVHHAIMFRIGAADLPQAITLDKNGTGWPCFGGAGIGMGLGSFLTSPWISSWAPGRGVDISPAGYGIPYKKSERMVLQIHYNLLAAQGVGIKTDQSKVVIEAVASNGSTVKQLAVELFPAPVELACPVGITGPLCDRKKSLADLAARTSTNSAFEAAGVNLLCYSNPFNPPASTTSTCDKVITRNYNIIAAAPHMHLLGRSLTMTLNPGTPGEKVILDRQNYNFDDQSSTILKSPIAANAGDTIRVVCTFDPTLRQKLPALKGLEPRYVTWGEGSSDEMCLGVIAAN